MSNSESPSVQARWSRRLGLGLPVVALVAVLAASWPAQIGLAQDAATEAGAQTPAMMRVEPATYDEVQATPAGELLAEGRRVYDRYCVGCHGEQGDGNGPAAPFLFPKPRNFQTAVFKFGSRPNDLPTDADLMRTLNHGLRGTAMRDWRLLPTHEKDAVIAYLKTFAPEIWQEGPDEPPIAIPANPWADASPSRLKRVRERGETVYHGVATCWECHAAYVSPEKIIEYRKEFNIASTSVRDNVDRPVWKQDAWNNPVWPPDFTKDRIKTGTDIDNLYRVIALGIGGTAMPTWQAALPDDDLWAMAYYVQDLASQRNERVTAHGAGAE